MAETISYAARIPGVHVDREPTSARPQHRAAREAISSTSPLPGSSNNYIACGVFENVDVRSAAANAIIGQLVAPTYSSHFRTSSGRPHGLSRRQENSHHRRAVEPLDRVRRCARVPARGRDARVHVRQRRPEGARRQARRRFRAVPGPPLRRRRRTSRSTRSSPRSRPSGGRSTACCTRSRSRRARRWPAIS